MADPRELPDDIREFYELSKQYVAEEITQPAKRLGSFAGMGIGAGFVFALGALLLALGALELSSWLLPESDTWQAVAHLAAGVLAAIGAGILFRRVAR